MLYLAIVKGFEPLLLVPISIGALIIKTISSGCTMLSIPNTYTHIIIGIIIIIAVLIDGLRNGTPKWLFDRLR